MTTNDRRRVVITGMGAVTPLGNDPATFWSRLVAGESGVRTIGGFDPARLTSRIAGEVHGFDPGDVLDRKEQRRNDRVTQFALVATRQAMDQAGLPGRLEGTLAEETGAIIGSGLGGSTTLFDQIRVYAERGPDRISPFFVPMVIANMAAGQVAITTGALGPNYATVSACATAGHAIGEVDRDDPARGRRDDARRRHRGPGRRRPRRGLRGHARAVDAQRRSGRRQPAVRPGTRRLRHRRGRRGARARGGGPRRPARGDASWPRSAAMPRPPMRRTSPCPRQAASAPCGPPAEPWSRRASRPPRSTIISAHATSTPEGDPAELAAFRSLLGDHAAAVSITATKGAIGHTLGAAGGIGAVATVMAMREGQVPPTLNLVAPDEAVGELDCTPLVARERSIRVALVNAFGFGGQNTAIVLRRWEG